MGFAVAWADAGAAGDGGGSSLMGDADAAGRAEQLWAVAGGVTAGFEDVDFAPAELVAGRAAVHEGGAELGTGLGSAFAGGGGRERLGCAGAFSFGSFCPVMGETDVEAAASPLRGVADDPRPFPARDAAPLAFAFSFACSFFMSARRSSSSEQPTQATQYSSSYTTRPVEGCMAHG